MTTHQERAAYPSSEMRPSTDTAASAVPNLDAEFYRMPAALRRPEKRRMERAIVAPERVIPELRKVAFDALRVAVAELDLPPVTIRWLAPPRLAPTGPRRMVPAGRDAFVEPIDHPREIFLSVFAQTPVSTVLHESRHLWQYPNGMYPDGAPCQVDGCGQVSYTLTPEDEDRLELDAFRWAATTMRELLLPEFPRCEARGLIR